MARNTPGATAATAEPQVGGGVQDDLSRYLDSLPPLEREPDENGDLGSDDDDYEGKPDEPVGDIEDEADEEAESDESDDEEKPAAEDEEKPADETETAPELTAEEKQKAEETQQFADLGRSWMDQLSRDPAGTMARIAETLEQSSPGVKAQLLEQLGVKDAAQVASDSGFDASNYEPYSDGEAELLKHLDDIRGIRDLPTRVEKNVNQILAQNLNGFARTLAPYLDGTAAQTEILAAKVDAVLEHLGLSLDTPDLQGVLAELNEGKKSHRDVVRGKIGDAYSKAVQNLRQAQAARPDTPGGSGEGISAPRADNDGFVSLRDIQRAVRGR